MRTESDSENASADLDTDFVATRPLRIAMVAPALDPLRHGGCDAEQLGILATRLAAAGHEVSVLTRREDRRSPAVTTADGGYELVRVPVGPPKPVDDGEALQLMGEFGGVLEAQWSALRPDIAHAHGWLGGVTAQLAAKFHAIPVIQSFHHLGADEARRRGGRTPELADRMRLEPLIARGSTQVLADSIDQVIELGRMGHDRTRTAIVPRGVDLTCFHPAEQREPGITRIAMTADPVAGAGIDTAIEALRRLRGVELAVATRRPHGNGDEVKRLRTLAKRHRVSPRVHFIDTATDAAQAELLRSAQLVIAGPPHASERDVVGEALATGLPVVATAVGTQRDGVIEGETGRVVPEGSAGALALAVATIGEDAELIATLGRAARERAEAALAWPVVIARTLRVYTRSVSAPPQPRLEQARVRG